MQAKGGNGFLTSSKDGGGWHDAGAEVESNDRHRERFENVFPGTYGPGAPPVVTNPLSLRSGCSRKIGPVLYGVTYQTVGIVVPFSTLRTGYDGISGRLGHSSERGSGVFAFLRCYHARRIIPKGLNPTTAHDHCHSVGGLLVTTGPLIISEQAGRQCEGTCWWHFYGW